jgi:hypothetical protein
MLRDGIQMSVVDHRPKRWVAVFLRNVHQQSGNRRLRFTGVSFAEKVCHVLAAKLVKEQRLSVGLELLREGSIGNQVDGEVVRSVVG